MLQQLRERQCTLQKQTNKQKNNSKKKWCTSLPQHFFTVNYSDAESRAHAHRGDLCERLNKVYRMLQLKKLGPTQTHFEV